MLTLLVAVALIAAVALIGWSRSNRRIARASKARNRVAQLAESEAEQLLVSQGYAVLERQIEKTWILLVDGAPRRVKCRADLLVERDHRLFVADVKSGTRAPDPALPATRRQLLEYVLAFAEVDGVLVVDMTRQQIAQVDFSVLLEGA